MLDKSIVGQESPPKTVMAEPGQMKFFAKATGAVDQIYWDEEAAMAAGHPGLPAAPTYLFCLNNFAPSKGPSILAQLGVDIGRVLHGEQRFKYGKPIYAGDEITLQDKVIDAYEKKGGALQFILTETAATNQHGESVGSMTNSLVIRN
ncbi:MAG: MaoC family dehydratase N-terminal domain-containing protein [Pseudomonadaceae bacterium]|nr:MaoC family dehydratase N-terminal domain-containing protein [Pseudomonadaceae bacterium]MEE4283283.1 MaoC family dehydratase N-terminal domain-containing protein [Pseudomonadales bacterium]